MDYRAAAFRKHREQFHLNTQSSSGEQLLCSSSTRAAVSAAREPLLHYVFHWSSCICAQRAAAPRAPAELLFVLRRNSCSMCFSGAVVCDCAPSPSPSRAAVCARRKLLLHWSCSLCSGKSRMKERKELLRVFQWNCSLCF